ncbi:MAG: T9SS type A sorting domain-containing protein [Chitinophagales bacterium]|nr:T9SS type A sorting domain-containing protein [Chitinophagales bacterium]
MQKILPIFAALTLSITAFSQHKYDYIWWVGYGSNNPANHFGGTKFDFNQNDVDVSFYPLPDKFGFGMPCSISDENGNLQFSSNGCRIVNFNNEVIENGDDLSPGIYHDWVCDESPYYYDAAQDMLILPRPGHPGRYVYFHPSTEQNISSGKILYSEVDMNANNGQGKVIDKNHLLRGPVTKEGIINAVKHANGRDWWVLIPEAEVNIYNFYLLTPDTIMGPLTQNLEDSEAALYPKAAWNSFVSPDGKKFGHVTLTWVDGVNRFNRIFLYDFDRCTGALSNRQILKVDDPEVFASWAHISPNSRYMYFQIAQNKLYQYDLQAPDLEASRLLIAEHDGFTTPLGFSTAFFGMATAPNGKIYMCTTSGTYYYHTIHSPNKRGTACDFRQHDLELPTVSDNLMPLYPNFRLGPVDGSSCDTLGINNNPVADFRWEQKDTLSPLIVDFTDLSYFEPEYWSWNFGDGEMSQDTSPVHQFNAPGIYDVCLTVGNANQTDFICKDIKINLLHDKNINYVFDALLLSPNPVSDMLHLQISGNTGKLQIFNATGQILSQMTIAEPEEQVSVNVFGYPPGLFFVNLQTQERVLSGRFIKN